MLKVLVAHSCLTFCDPMNLSGSSVCGISQARLLVSVAISFMINRQWVQVSGLGSGRAVQFQM